MRRLIQEALRSMEWRLLVPLAITVGVVLAIHATVSFRTTRQHFIALVHNEANRASGLIRQATHDGMLLNRFDDVQTLIERLVEQGDVTAIRVCDKEGIIILSANQEEIGTKIPIESGTCLSCHGDEVPKGFALLEQSEITQVDRGADVLRHLSVIENEPACSAAPCHFHPADKAVLGVLDVGLSMEPLQAAIGASQRQFVSTTILLVVISGLVSAIFVRRVIHQPARELFRGTTRVAAGDLETRIEVEGDHELARLADAFNRMMHDLRSAREEITMWSETLEQRVAAKSNELERAQHQIRHMEKMASLGKLSATVAHELNNPLSGMLTYAKLIKRELESQSLPDEVHDELARYLDLVAAECTHCGSIVHNLLTFARRTGSEMATIRINDVVGRSMMLVRHHFEMSNIRLTSLTECEDDRIIADADQIQQAVIALLVNAAEATINPTASDAAVTVRTSDDADSVTIEVTDNGMGIEPAHIPSLFEPFFTSKSDREHGVGLGLAVVYGIVNRHRGVIMVDSKPGEGATFRIRLPRNLDDIDGSVSTTGLPGTIVLKSSNT
jgi:two-component system NtrC family sensor kinase